MKGIGKRTAESYEGDPNGAPELFITYKCDDSNNDGICDVCPGGMEPGDPCDDGDSGTYNDLIDSNCDCIGTPYDCPSIQANFGDPCDDGDPGTYNDIISPSCICEGIQYDCPVIPANIGDVCDDGDSNTTNDMIDSNCNCVGTPQTNNISCVKISTSSDDAEEKPNGNLSLSSSDLEMIVDGSNDQIIGLRFSNLNIPQYATINSADIQFTVDQTDNVNPCNLQIYGEAVDDASTFSGNYDISTRSKTSAYETWSPANWVTVGEAGPDQKTVDLSSIIQEIVNRSGYTSNSSIVIIIEGVGKRTAESFNASPSWAPEMCVEYFDPPQSLGVNPNSTESETSAEELKEEDDTKSFENSAINIYPNPARDRLYVSFEASKRNLVRIEIMDLNGRQLISDTKEIFKGTNQIILDDLDLESGIYFIQLRFQEKVFASKFTILK